MSLIESGLQVHLSSDVFEVTLSRYETQIADAILETLDAGSIDAAGVDGVVSVGGSSSMNIVVDAIQRCLPNVRVDHGDIFTSIVDGLAIASAVG